ncbi:IS701 family transposase [Mycobacterium sp.]|uniref:IS701 family transposase n=1 Tax=Mycobacterium sp. TaxID=1785 RepID=UPI003C793FAA
MLQPPTIPASLHALLETFRPAFRRSSTFAVFGLLVTGLIAQTARRTVVGMLAGAGVAAVVSFHTVCRFFSHHAWDADRIGLALARLIVDRLLGEHAAIEVAIDDTLIRRWGPKVFGAFWTHDGSAQGPHALGRGNRWIIAGIVVTLPFCSHPVCLPILLRLWRGKGTDSPVRLAGELISILAQEFPDRRIHVVGDAAYHGKSLLVPGATITTRLPANAVLYAPAPPRTGGRGRPRLKGHRLGTPAEIAATAGWRRVRICRYGRVDTVEIAQTPSIWYGAFGNTAGRVVLVREPDGEKVLAIFTTDTDSGAQAIGARYAHRWPIETAIAGGKQLLGIGQTRNRLQQAVERTVPFQFCVYSLVIVWYALYGHHPDDITSRREQQPWYPHKDEPAFEDMLAKLRRTLLAARITGVSTAQPDPRKYRDYELACAAAAA